MCDVPACLEATALRGVDLRFNLCLHDPIESYLSPDETWRDVGGEYTVTLGAESGAEVGRADGLRTLDASVGAFTRLWLGVAPATGLALTDELSGPAELLSELDWAFRLPTPTPNWDF
jgi:hypothetical protein